MNSKVRLCRGKGAHMNSPNEPPIFCPHLARIYRLSYNLALREWMGASTSIRVGLLQNTGDQADETYQVV